MKKSKILKTIVALFVLFTTTNIMMGQEANINGTLTVAVSKMQHDIGKLVVNLFREGDDIMKEPFFTINRQYKKWFGKH